MRAYNYSISVETNSVDLEHFYHAKLIENGHPIADIQLAAHSPRLTANDWARVRSLTKIEPSGDDRTVCGEASTAIGLFSADDAGHILVQAQRTTIRDRGVFLPSYHYVLLPPGFLAECGGNWIELAAMSFGNISQPTFPQRSVIPPIRIDARPSNDLTSYIAESQQIVGGTVPSLVQAIADSDVLYIANAPADVAARLRFLQGLTALLPAGDTPTFVTHCEPDVHPEVRICFTLEGNGEPVYEWGTPPSFKIVRGSYAAWVYDQMPQPETILRIQSAISAITRGVFAQTDRRHAYDLTAAFSRILQCNENRVAPNVDDLWLIVETAPIPPALRTSFFAMLSQVMDKREPANVIRWYVANNQVDRIGALLATSPSLAQGVFKRLANQSKAVVEVIAGFELSSPPTAVADEVYLKAFDNLALEVQKPLLAILMPRFSTLTLATQMRLIHALIDHKRVETIGEALPLMRFSRPSETLQEVLRAAQYGALILGGLPNLRDTLQTVWLSKLRGYSPDDIFPLIVALRARPELAVETRTFETACFFLEWMGTVPADTLAILEQMTDPGVYLSQLSDYLAGLTKPLPLLTDQFQQATQNWLSHDRALVADTCIELADLITTDFYLKDAADQTVLSVTPAQMTHWLSQVAKSVMPDEVTPLPPLERFFQETWPSDLPVVLEVLKTFKTSLDTLRIKRVDTRMARLELLSRIEAAEPGESIGLVLYYVYQLGEVLSAANLRPVRKPGDIELLNEGKFEKAFANRAELVDILRWTAGKLRSTK
ncbi:MAG TPA: hypothetical protein VMT34_09830 [Aggregatilineales bacterium]|nr:hypothetical protein [Aggregatilineales bacterium]